VFSRSAVVTEEVGYMGDPSHPFHRCTASQIGYALKSPDIHKQLGIQLWRLGIPVLVNYLLDEGLLYLRGNLCTNKRFKSHPRKGGVDKLA